MKTIKTIITAMILLWAINGVKAQYVSIPDITFGGYLQLYYPSCITYSGATGYMMDTTCPQIVTSKLISIPPGTATFSDLTGVQYFDELITLYCAGNMVSYIPALPAKLRWLECSDNLLTTLPPFPDSLSRIECRGNQLTSLPALPRKLDTLIADSNLLTYLPPLPTDIRFLSCIGNAGIYCLPEMQVVRELYFSGTGISCLPTFPQLNTVIIPSGLPLCHSSNPYGCFVPGTSILDRNLSCISLPGGIVTMGDTGTGTWIALADNPGSAIITRIADPVTTITGFSVQGTYRFVWQAAVGRSDTATVYVSARPDAGPDQATTVGGYASMSSIGTGTWAAAGGNPGAANITAPSLATSTITGFTIPGSYYFTWTTGTCLDTALVLVSPVSNVGIAGPDQTVPCTGALPNGLGTLTATGTGTWSILPGNPGNSGLVNPNSANCPVAGFTSIGTYRYLWTGTGGQTDTVRVTVLSAADAGPDMTVTVGSTATMAAVGSGRWTTNVSPGNTFISDPAEPTTTITGFNILGTYRFTWTDTTGCSDQVDIIAAPGAVAGPDQIVPCGVLTADTAVMAAIGTGTWSIGVGNPGAATIIDPSNPATTITGFSALGIYSFIWTTATGSDTATVTLSSARAGADQIVPCVILPGGSAILSSPDPAGTWSAPSGNPGTAVISTPSSPSCIVSSFSAAGDYHFIWTTTGGCMDTTVVTISTGLPAPILTESGLCFGADSLVLSGYHTGFISWYLDGNLIDSTMFPVQTVVHTSNPIGLHIDGAGYYYVGTIGGTVWKFPPNSDASTIGTIIAGGNGSGTALNQLSNPKAITVDAAGNVYVGDETRVLKFPAGSTSATNGMIVAGGNGVGSAANQMDGVGGLYIDVSGDLYVSDEHNFRVQKFPAGSNSGTNGITVAGGNGSGSAANQIYYPEGLAIDQNGNLYVADFVNGRVLQFPPGSTSSTNSVTVAGHNGAGSADNQLVNPIGITLDATGNLYIADAGNSRIMKYPAGSTSATHGILVAGGNGDGLAANQISPSQIQVDNSGNIYTLDISPNNRIQKWTAANIDTVYYPTAPGLYYAYTRDFNGCLSPFSNVIEVTPCLSDSVWPGDADHNGITDNNDLLPVGIGYGLNGLARIDRSIIWSAHYAQDWGLQFTSGVDAKFADCNGDGLIDANDTTAILTNFGLTHAKTDGSGAPWRSAIAGIRLQYSNDTVSAGDSLVVNLLLGDSATPVSDIYGLAFTYHFDPLVVDSSSIAFGFTNSFIGNATDKISIHKDFRTDGLIKAAVTGINHVNRSGYGLFARFSCIITTDNLNGKDLSYYSNVNFISDIMAIDKDGNNVPLNAGTDSNQVAFEPTGIRDIATERLSIYPNPANDQITASVHSSIRRITITDVLGREVQSLPGNNTASQTVDISRMTAGIYTVAVYTPQGSGQVKLAIQH